MSKLAILGGDKTVKQPFPRWPVWDEQDRRDLIQVLESGKWWLYAYPAGAGGDGDADRDISQVEQFEREFARAHFTRHCYAVNTGTSGLELVLQACDIGPGDEVITTAYTFVATSSAIFDRCALPVYVDIDPETYQIDPRRIEEAVTPRTRAIIVVHLGGEICDMDAVMAIALRHNLAVIEDAAQAAGSTLTNERAAGGLGRAGIFSFQASKAMTAGEGGLCSTQDDELAEIIWSLRNCGRSRTGAWYEHHRIGHNLRMPEWQGVLLRGQLGRLRAQCENRMANHALLCEKLRDLPGVVPRRLNPQGSVRNTSIAIMRFTGERWEGLHRDAVIEALNAEGVPCSGGYGWANYANPAFVNMQEAMGHRAFAFGVERFPDWAAYAERCPMTERACRDEAIFLMHNIFNGEAADMQMIADAFFKVYEHRKALAGRADSAGQVRGG